MPRTRLLGLFVGLLVASPLLAAEPSPPSAEPLTFEKHIRPLFKVHCIHCHGEADEHEGGLDLRLRRLMLKGGESGPAIEPGHAQESLLVQRLRAGEMPPGDKKKLPPHEITVIERWIAQGAKTARPEPETLTAENLFTDEERQFWSFQPIQRPEVPRVRATQGVRTPIDAFIVQKLEAEGLTLSPEADRLALVRRAYLDLLGLPPTPAEVQEFVADASPEAYERLIDRLLDRPEYGERWGRHWLDVAGYADSDGYTPADPVRQYAYKYRDYVIQAMNADKPLDEFIREQLAGDELISYPRKDLKPDEIEKLVATGFLRMAPDGTAAGDVDQNVARNQVVADTLKIVSTSLLGLTVGCAECHDHKYDPISQADYYSFRAVFEPALDWKNWKPPRGRLASLASDEDRKQTAALEAEAAKVDQQRTKLQQEFIAKTFEEELVKLPEELRDSVREAFKTEPAKRTAEHKKLLKENPSINVSAGSLYFYDAPKQAAVRAAEAKLAARKKEMAAKKDDAEAAQELAAQELTALSTEIERLRALVGTDQVKKLTDEAAAIRARKPKEDFVHALCEVPGKVPATFVFYRGDFAQPKQTVEPGEPMILALHQPGAIPTKSGKLATTGRRLALAEQLTAATHPLVGRVLVNRVWLHHFGRGLVSTPTDFGVLGERPTHPELLDWLAREFIDHGWRLKRLHKLIMTSSVYRQSSRHIPEQDAVDPENRLLARMHVRRAEAEVIRDSILAVSGKLNPKRFGPTVPVMPDEVGQVVIGVDTRDTAGRPSGKVVSLGDDVYRRSVYVQVRRSLPLGMLEMFDAPSMTSNCNCESRNTSTVAPQSLLMMNSEFLIEQARFCAERLEREAPNGLEAQVKLAWQLALSRAPEPDELKDAVIFVSEQAATFAAKDKDAKEKDAKDKVQPQTLALTNLCQALLSSNEFLYVD